MMLNLPIQKLVCASTYLYLLQFLSSVPHNFLSTGLLHPWLGLFLGILLILKQVQMRLLFISLFVSLLLAYKNTTDLYILILYIVSLLNLFSNSGNFLAISLGFSLYNNLSSANKKSFTNSFPIWMLLFLLLVWRCG